VHDRVVMYGAYGDGIPAVGPESLASGLVHLTLRRRRLKFPWVYAVYHAASHAPDDTGPGAWCTRAGSVAESDPRYACFRRRMNAGTSSSAAAPAAAAASAGGATATPTPCRRAIVTRGAAASAASVRSRAQPE
jgi:hypothetical protein